MTLDDKTTIIKALSELATCTFCSEHGEDWHLPKSVSNKVCTQIMLESMAVHETMRSVAHRIARVVKRQPNTQPGCEASFLHDEMRANGWRYCHTCGVRL